MSLPTRKTQQAALSAVLGFGFADLALLIFVLGPAMQRQHDLARSRAPARVRLAAVSRGQAQPGPVEVARPASGAAGTLAAAGATPAPQPPRAEPQRAAARAPERPAGAEERLTRAGAQAVAPASARPEPLPVLLFGTGAAGLTWPMRRILRGVAATMRASDDLRLLCRSHADARGAAEANLVLSRRRAQSVAAALVQLGVARDRLTLEAVGASEPVDPASNPAAWARNRRVELRWQ